jgi:hypothetical protein
VQIWHIFRPDEAVGYDEVSEVVIIANTSDEARTMFASRTAPGQGPGDEGASAWLDIRQSTALCIGTASAWAASGVVVRHFAAG